MRENSAVVSLKSLRIESKI